MLRIFGFCLMRRSTAKSLRAEAWTKDAELAEVRSRYAAHAKTAEEGHRKRVAALEANAETLTTKIVELHRAIESHAVGHATRTGNLVAELKSTRQALEKALRTVAEMREVLDAA